MNFSCKKADALHQRYIEKNKLICLLGRSLPHVEEMASLTESDDVADLAKEIREVLGME